MLLLLTYTYNQALFRTSFSEGGNSFNASKSVEVAEMQSSGFRLPLTAYPIPAVPRSRNQCDVYNYKVV